MAGRQTDCKRPGNRSIAARGWRKTIFLQRGQTFNGQVPRLTCPYKDSENCCCWHA